MISSACPKCGHLVQIGAEAVGKRIKCPVFVSRGACYVNGISQGLEAGGVDGESRQDPALTKCDRDTADARLRDRPKSFAVTQGHAVGNGRVDINVAHFNGKGHADLAVADEKGKRRSLLFGNWDPHVLAAATCQ